MPFPTVSGTVLLRGTTQGPSTKRPFDCAQGHFGRDDRLMDAALCHRLFRDGKSSARKFFDLVKCHRDLWRAAARLRSR